MTTEGTQSYNENVLFELLSRGSDVQLVFGGDTEQSFLPCHSQILSTWSSVLGGALEAGSESARGSCVCSGRQELTAERPDICSHSTATLAAGGCATAAAAARRVPMPGTSKEEFLEVAAFMYPVIPPAQVTWSNLETLLVLGAKYDMPAILVRAAAFIENHMCLLDMAEGGSRFIWKWLPLLDAAGLDDMCNQCIQRAVQLDRTSCSVECRLLGLSNRALQRLVVCLALSNTNGFVTDNSIARRSYPGATGSGSGGYKLYHSVEVASILDQPLP